WGPRAIGDHGAPVSLPKLKKAYEKGTRGISWGPLLTLGPRALKLATEQAERIYNIASRGGQTTHGNRGSWGPCVLAHTQSTPKKAYKRYQRNFMGAPY
ncbi:unnamed protein product, partial [Staurois parvus]